MQREIKPIDMSLQDRIAVLERRMDKLGKKVEWQDERQDEVIEKVATYLNSVMSFLDGAKRYIGMTTLSFKKETLDLKQIAEREEEKAKEFLAERAFELEAGQ